MRKKLTRRQSNEAFVKVKTLQKMGMKNKQIAEVLNLSYSTVKVWTRYETIEQCRIEAREQAKKKRKRQPIEQAKVEAQLSDPNNEPITFQKQRLETGSKMLNYQVALLQEMRAMNKQVQQLTIKMTELVEIQSQISRDPRVVQHLEGIINTLIGISADCDSKKSVKRLSFWK